MKTSMPNYSLFKFFNKRSSKLDTLDYRYVRKFILRLNRMLNSYIRNGYYNNEYLLFYSDWYDITSISEVYPISRLFTRSEPSYIISSVDSFVKFINNYSDIRSRQSSKGAFVLFVDFVSFFNDVLSKQF